MALANFDDLKGRIDAWMWRDDLDSSGDAAECITLAEARMNRDLRLNWLERRATLGTTANDPFVVLPTDEAGVVQCNEIRKLSFDRSPSRKFLTFESPESVACRNLEGTVGEPRYYNIVGNEINLVPTPDAAYTLYCTYLAKLIPLSATNTTNDILTNFPDLYLYSCLVEAALFVREDERVGIWENRYQAALTAARKADMRLKYNGAPLIERAG